MQKVKQTDSDGVNGFKYANCVTPQDIFTPFFVIKRKKFEINIYVFVTVLTKDTIFLQIQMIHCYLTLLVPLCIMADHEKQTRYTQRKTLNIEKNRRNTYIFKIQKNVIKKNQFYVEDFFLIGMSEN